MKKLAIFLVLGWLLSAPALAADTGALTEALPDSAAEILGPAAVEDALEGDGLFRAVGDWLLDHLTAYGREAARAAGAVLGVTLLASAAGAVSESNQTPGYVLMGGALAIFGVCAADLRSFLGETTAALGDLSLFSRTLLPTLTSASAAAGRAASAGARYAVSALFLDILIGLGSDVILPGICAYAAVSTAEAALPEGVMAGPVKLLGWACRTLLTALTSVFTLALALSGVIAGGADRLAGAAAKTALSAGLPVVGSILADAAETYLAGARLIRGAVGLFGLAAVLAVCAGPALKLGLRYLLFRAAACLLAPFAEARLAALVENMASAFGMALGLVGSAGLMLFTSIAVGMGVLSG